MADVIQLPTAAREPVVNHRRRGSYGRKVISFTTAQNQRRFREQREREAELQLQKGMVETCEWLLQEAKRGKISAFIGWFVHDGDHEGDTLIANCGGYRNDVSLAREAAEDLLDYFEALEEEKA